MQCTNRRLFTKLAACLFLLSSTHLSADTQSVLSSDPITSLTADDGNKDENRTCLEDLDRDGVYSFFDLYVSSFTRVSINECFERGGIIADDIPIEEPKSLAALSSLFTRRPRTWRSLLTPTPKEVLDVVNDSGIPSRPYVPEKYDCDDFADDAEQELERVFGGSGKDVEATVTLVFCAETDKDGNFVDILRAPIKHAISDFHRGGKSSWFEPQGGGWGQALDINFLDLNGDGYVTWTQRGGPDAPLPKRPTEFSAIDFGCWIGVYPSKEVAEFDWGPLDKTEN